MISLHFMLDSGIKVGSMLFSYDTISRYRELSGPNNTAFLRNLRRLRS